MRRHLLQNVARTTCAAAGIKTTPASTTPTTPNRVLLRGPLPFRFKCPAASAVQFGVSESFCTACNKKIHHVRHGRDLAAYRGQCVKIDEQMLHLGGFVGASRVAVVASSEAAFERLWPKIAAAVLPETLEAAGMWQPRVVDAPEVLALADHTVPRAVVEALPRLLMALTSSTYCVGSLERGQEKRIVLHKLIAPDGATASQKEILHGSFSFEHVLVLDNTIPQRALDRIHALRPALDVASATGAATISRVSGGDYPVDADFARAVISTFEALVPRSGLLGMLENVPCITVPHTDGRVMPLGPVDSTIPQTGLDFAVQIAKECATIEGTPAVPRELRVGFGSSVCPANDDKVVSLNVEGVLSSSDAGGSSDGAALAEGSEEGSSSGPDAVYKRIHCGLRDSDRVPASRHNGHVQYQTYDITVSTHQPTVLGGARPAGYAEAAAPAEFPGPHRYDSAESVPAAYRDCLRAFRKLDGFVLAVQAYIQAYVRQLKADAAAEAEEGQLGGDRGVAEGQEALWALGRSRQFLRKEYPGGMDGSRTAECEALSVKEFHALQEACQRELEVVANICVPVLEKMLARE